VGRQTFHEQQNHENKQAIKDLKEIFSKYKIILRPSVKV